MSEIRLKESAQIPTFATNGPAFGIRRSAFDVRRRLEKRENTLKFSRAPESVLERLAFLGKTMTEQAKDKLCFVICPIGDEKSATRDRSDKVFRYLITPPAQEAGYQPKRADHIDRPGIITSQVIEHVIEAPLVIADLTDRNPNVFYELAIRHAVNKPLIQLISRQDQIPFDVAPTRIIQFDLSDIESVERAKAEITKQIRSLHTDASPVDNPISMALDLKALKRSEDPKDRSLGEVLTAVTELRAQVADSMAQRSEELLSVLTTMRQLAIHQQSYREVVEKLAIDLGRIRESEVRAASTRSIGDPIWRKLEEDHGPQVHAPSGVQFTRRKIEENDKKR